MPARPPFPRLAGAAIALAAGLGSPPAGALPPPASVTAPVTPPAKPDPITLDLGPRIGGAGRLGSSASLPITNRGGEIFGVGVALAPSPRFTVGLSYEHSGLGGERGVGDVADIAVGRSLDALWATLRLDVLKLDGFDLGVTVGPGIAWQHASADVIVFDPTGVPSTFLCSDSGSASLGLRAGLGIAARITEHVWFTADAVFDNLHLSSDPLGSCALGAGTVSLLGLRAGFVYRLDVSRFVR
jgi:hypothetical protein